MLATRRYPRKGKVAVIIAISLTMIMGAAALTLDGSMLVSERRQAQAIANASALAGAYQLYTNNASAQNPDPGGMAKAAAIKMASYNGYINTTSNPLGLANWSDLVYGLETAPVQPNAIITVNIPPVSGRFQGQAGYIEVIATNLQARHFSAIWDSSSLQVSARSVARGLNETFGPSVLVGSPTASNVVTGTAPLSIVNGTLAINSTSNSALTGSGSASALTLKLASNQSVPSGYTGSITRGPTLDPYTKLVLPVASSYTTQASSATTTNSLGLTLFPGVYTGGISASGTGSITMLPGVYVLSGGGLSITGSASLTGTNVVIYNAAQSSSDVVNIATAGLVSLTPPTSGAYTGFSILQKDPSSSTSPMATNPITLAGSGLLTNTGAIYAPNANLNLGGSSANPSNAYATQLVANQVVTSGSNPIKIGSVGTPPPIRETRQVE